MNESAEYQMFEALDAAVAGRMMDQEMADAIADIIIESILEKDSRDKPRPTVAAFALLMEAELRKHDDRAGWTKCDPHWLLRRLREEVSELRAALLGHDEFVPQEAADVANFAMMIADVSGGLKPAPSPDPSRSSTAEQAPYKGQVAGSIPAGTTSPLPAEVEEAMGRMEGAVKDCYASMKVGWYGTADEMYRLDQAALAVIKSALSKPAPLPSPSVEEPIQIVFDGPPAHEAGRFVEVEQGGRSINFGEWKQREDGYWVLEFPREAALSAKEKS